jgi:CheY-like chemotaxis protein
MNYTATTPKPHKAPILVIEDNADQWFIIRWALQQQFPEVEAVWVRDATEAQIYLESCEKKYSLPKLILLDLYLPNRQQGWSVLGAIKTHHLYREIPVIMLSQSNDKEDIAESYSLRVNSYIVKPNHYQKWLDCIGSFRHYWWDAVTLPKFR